MSKCSNTQTLGLIGLQYVSQFIGIFHLRAAFFFGHFHCKSNPIEKSMKKDLSLEQCESLS